jgi:hypothetical protein
MQNDVPEVKPELKEKWTEYFKWLKKETRGVEAKKTHKKHYNFCDDVLVRFKQFSKKSKTVT